MLQKLKTGWKKFTHDKKGNSVLWQSPNLPIIGWAVFRILTHTTNDSNLRTGFDFLAEAFLFTWAYLEITQGASYFRRVLGILIMILVIASYFNR